MRDHPGIDAAEVDAALERLLERHPRSGVAAMRLNGIFVAMPESVPVVDHAVLDGRSGIDLVAPADRLPMARAWGDARSAGMGRTLLHLLDGHAAMCHFFDVRDRHGVFVMVMVPQASEGSAPDDVFTVASQISPRVCSMLVEETAVIASTNDAVTGMLGWASGELVGVETLEHVHPDDHVRVIDSWMATLAAPGVAHRMRCRYQRKDGSWLWVEITMVVRTEPPHEGMIDGEMVDISEEMAANDTLRDRERMLHQLTEALPSGVVQVDPTGRIVHKNDRVNLMLGHPEATTLERQFSRVSRPDRDTVERAFQAALRGQPQEIEVRVEAAPVAPSVCQVLLRPLTDESGATSGAIVSVSDITESTVLRTELQLRATFDALTEVHNRASIMTLLQGELDRDRPVGSGVAAIFLDLDRFKLVNDRLGHSSGDRVLTVVAERLRGAVRGSDLVGRLGGDEFLIVCPSVESAAAAQELAQRVADKLRGPVALGGGTIEVRASVGTAWSAERRVAADALVARADAAMYESKHEGIGRPIVAALAASAPPAVGAPS